MHLLPAITQSSTATPLSSIAKTDDQLMAVCEDFESLFIAQMFKEMRATIPDDGLIPRSNGEKMFQEMLDWEYSRSMSRSNPRGLAALMYQQMKPSVPAAQVELQG